MDWIGSSRENNKCWSTCTREVELETQDMVVGEWLDFQNLNHGGHTCIGDARLMAIANACVYTMFRMVVHLGLRIRVLIREDVKEMKSLVMPPLKA